MSDPTPDTREAPFDLATLRRVLPAINDDRTAEAWNAFGRIERALGHGIYATPAGPDARAALLRDMPTAKRHDSDERPMVGWVPHADYELLQLWVQARLASAGPEEQGEGLRADFCGTCGHGLTLHPAGACRWGSGGVTCHCRGVTEPDVDWLKYLELAATPAPDSGAGPRNDEERAVASARIAEFVDTGNVGPVLTNDEFYGRAPDTGAEERLRAARFVAIHWRDAVMASDTLRQTGMSHPLAMVLAALNGETEPRELGLSDDVHDAFRNVLSGGSVDEEAGNG